MQCTKKYFYLVLILFCLTSFFPFEAISNDFDPPVFSMPENISDEEYIPGKIIFKLREEARPQKKAEEITMPGMQRNLVKIGATETQRIFPEHTPPVKALHVSGQPYIDLSLIYKTEVPGDISLEEAINSLYASGMVEYAQPWYIPKPLFEPDDPFTGSQYYLNNIQAFEAWAIEQGDTNIVIAIVDTGIDLFHPDLIHDIAYNYDDPINGEDSDNDGYIDNFYGWDLGENDNYPQYNANPHGIHVAGIAGASTNNGTGMAGVGFNSRILPVKVSDADGKLVKAYEGIVYAADQGAQVINCSWGGVISPGQFGQDIINYAVINKDAVVIAAAGNSNNQVRLYPASYNNAVSVAATNINDLKWEGSSFGNLVDLSAPGAAIFSTWTNGSYLSGNGTSMAAPMVSGAAALLRAHYPEYSAMQIAAQLKVTTDIIDTIQGNEDYAGLMGTGRLNIFRALTENHHPYILLTEFEHPVSHYQLYNPGEAFSLGARFKNLLASAQNITAVISTNSQYIDVISGESLLGSLEHMSIADNFENPFMLQISPDIPPSHEINFTISFFTETDAFAGRQNFTLTFNLDYLHMQVNQIQTTVNSKGNIGYNYPNYSQGLGFLYSNTNQNRSLIRSAGFLAGVSTAKVVDNIYGAVENSFSNLLTPRKNARKKDEPLMGDLHITGSFTDSLAGTAKIGIKVNYDVYAFEEAPADKFLILEYQIINQSGENLPGFYAAFFADWSLQDIRNHRAAFDAENKMGYAFSANGGNYKGIQLLSHDNVRHYAFDNQGFGGSINISDGFTSFEKYTALKSTRNTAGVFDKDNDISTLLGAGPFLFQKDDTLHIAFALLAGDHINDLQASAQLAAMIYNGDEELSSREPHNKFLVLALYPNPITHTLNLEFFMEKPGKIEIRIYDINARMISSHRKNIAQPGKQLFRKDAEKLLPGSYIIQVITPEKVQSIKFSKQ
ncbi:MAG: T9SS C-terminal target domain-containing protein [Bacteroidetes bacterium]|nr:MAG: T9SS C-terminal target domain-containing protein [Bacteroidota bacterium]